MIEWSADTEGIFSHGNVFISIFKINISTQIVIIPNGNSPIVLCRGYPYNFCLCGAQAVTSNISKAIFTTPFLVRDHRSNSRDSVRVRT